MNKHYQNQNRTILVQITYFKSAIVLFFKQRAVVPQSRLSNEKFYILVAQGHVKLRDVKAEGTKKHCITLVNNDL